MSEIEITEDVVRAYLVECGVDIAEPNIIPERLDSMVTLLATFGEAVRRQARKSAIEECAKVAESDADWSCFGKAGLEPWQTGADDLRDYRLGIATGRAIAQEIRKLNDRGSAE